MKQIIKAIGFSYWKYLLIFFLLSLFSAFATTFIPYISGIFLDSLVTEKDTTFIKNFVFLLAIIIIFQLIISFVADLIRNYVSTHVILDIILQIQSHFVNVQFEVLESLDMKNVNQQLSSDSQSISKFLLDSCSNIVNNLFTFIFAIYFIIKINFRMALFLLLLLALYTFFLNFLKIFLFKKQLHTKNLNSLFFALLEKNLEMIRVNKIFNFYHLIYEQTTALFNKLKKSVMSLAIFSYSFVALDNVLMFFSQMIIFIIGGSLVISKDISIGDFSVLVSYFSMLIGASKYISSYISKYTETKVCISRLNVFLTLPVDKKGGFVLNNVKNITVDEVYYSRPDSMIPVLSGENYSFSKGNVYCFIGPNGSGKTTFLNILTGLYANFSGSIYIDSTNIKNLNLNSWLENNISYAPQNSIFLDHITVKEFLENKKRIDREILANFSIDHLLKKKMNSLSGGEIKKINLVYSITKKCDILVLDEPTNHLDATTKKYLYSYLKKLENQIVLISTHDENLLQIADEIIDLS